MVLDCPNCGSFLLVKHGRPSYLDGERNHLCLGCGADLQPRRLRGLLLLGFVLGVTMTAAAAILAAVEGVRGGPWRAVSAVKGAAVGVPAAVLSWRAMRRPVPRRVDAAFPDPRVRLTRLKLRPEGGGTADPEWVGPLSDYNDGVIRASVASLELRDRRYTVSVVTLLSGGHREHTLRHRGADEDGLERLFGELDRLPAFALPDGLNLRLEHEFRVG